MSKNSKKTQLLKELVEMIRNHQNVITDPMNGCPEDFAIDYGRVEQAQVVACLRAGASDVEITEAVSKGFKLAAEDYEEIFGDE